MWTFDDLAHDIDAASDRGDETSLRQLGEECERHLNNAEGEDRVSLRYYQSNTYSAIIAAKGNGGNYAWNWEQPDSIQNVLLLRTAISEPAFETINPVIVCQIRTNLANRLHSLGRPIAANEQLLKVLKIEPNFAKALANRALYIERYAGTLYDSAHKSILLAAARSLYDRALDDEAIWESQDRAATAPLLIGKREQIASYLAEVGYKENYDLDQWSLGATPEERSYRQWCLRECLFLNPLNEAYTDSVAATDILHLPSHTYMSDEIPRFPAYYNLMKQEYISARYRLYRAIHVGDPDFLMRDVLMLDSGESQTLGHHTEELRSAFRSAYAIFDKIGLFLNDYFKIGLKPRTVTFRKVWYEKQPNSANFEVRPMFKNYRNWLLQGLYFLSKDLFDENHIEVAEPDAADLARLRQQVEHRFLSFQHSRCGESTETHKLSSFEDFQDKTLRMLKMAREALIYISLAMHREEFIRMGGANDSDKVVASFTPTKIQSFERF